MRFLAAAALALAVVLVLAGCGGSLRTVAPETITVNLPSAKPARDVISTVTDGTPQVTPSTSHRSGAAARARRTAVPAVTPLSPRADARLNGVAIWLPYWALSTGVATAVDHADIIKVVHPFMDEITGTATVVDQSGGQEPTVAAELAARGIAVIPTVTETAQGSAFVHTLSHARPRRALLDALTHIAESGANDGIDLDFENMAIGDGSAVLAQRLAALYPRFVAELCTRLHADGRSCEVTVMAKNDAGRLGSGGLDTYVYDYAALAAAADRVQLMAYDDHVPSGAAGPIAPWPWVLSVLDYAMGQVPAGKLVLGIPSYGYEWNSRGENSSLTATGAEALAAGTRTPIRWSEVDAEPYFNYVTGAKRHRITHTVWFEDATAEYDRAVLAADDKLAGVDFWAAGDEDPQTWTMLARLKGS